jgi:hypothetical protein
VSEAVKEVGTVRVGLRFQWWVRFIPFLRGYLTKKAVRVLNEVRPASVIVKVGGMR